MDDSYESWHDCNVAIFVWLAVVYGGVEIIGEAFSSLKLAMDLYL